MIDRPTGYREVMAVFGDATLSSFEASHIVSVATPFTMKYRDDGSSPWSDVTEVRVHRLIAPMVTVALTDVWNHARIQAKLVSSTGLTSAEYDVLTHKWLAGLRLDEYGGGYNYRNVRGSAARLSMHAFGIALDFSPEAYPRGSERRMPQWWIDIWQKQGFFYGGDFTTVKDPMHVQYAEGC